MSRGPEEGAGAGRFVDRVHARMQSAFGRLCDALLARPRSVLVVSAVGFALLCVAGARLRLGGWIQEFLPATDRHLAAYVGALDRFGVSEMVFVDLSADDPDTLHAAADLVEERLRGSGSFARVLGRMTEWDAQRTAATLRASAPRLLDAEGRAELERRTSPEELEALMERHYEMLLGPAGGYYQDVLREDPLALTPLVLERLGAPAQDAAGARFSRGRLVSGDGRHALVTAVATARVGDEDAAAEIVALLARTAAELPQGADLAWLGGHRYYLTNSNAFRRDMSVVSAIGVSLVLLVVFLGFRGARIVWIATLAVVVGSVVAAAVLALVHGSVSGIALGFGAALSGIAVDYVIHLHPTRRAGETRRQAVRRVYAEVGPTVTIGAITSAAAFLVLVASPVPAHGQLGTAAGAGVLGALCFALFPGPILAAGRPDAPAALDARPVPVERISCALFGGILRRPRAAFLAAAALVAGGAAGLPAVEFESELRRFEAKDPGTVADEERIFGTWGGLFQEARIVLEGPDAESVLRDTDRLVAALRPHAGKEFAAISSTAAVLPAQETQERRLAEWREWWTPERRREVRAGLASAAADFGIRPESFDPWFEGLDASPPPVTRETVAETALAPLVDRHLSVRDDGAHALIVLAGAVPPESGEATWPRTVRETVPGAMVLSGPALADAVVRATREELLTLAVPALLLVWLLLAIYHRSAVLALVGIFPLIAGLVLAAGGLALLGEKLTLLNVAVALPVFGLGVDYAVFLVDALRDAPAEPAARRRAVGLRMGPMVGDVLTTFAGAAAMLLATTPALYSIGLAMVLGVGGTLVVAWLAVPQALAWLGRDGT